MTVEFTPWNKLLQMAKDVADKLDEADGKKDGKIDASVWNDYIGQYLEGDELVKHQTSKKKVKVEDNLNMLASHVVAKSVFREDVKKAYPIDNQEILDNGAIQESLIESIPKPENQEKDNLEQETVSQENRSLTKQVNNAGTNIPEVTAPEKLDKESEIKRLGLRTTWDNTGTFYYNTKEKCHYEWSGTTFVKREDIRTVDSDGTYTINKDSNKDEDISLLGLTETPDKTGKFYYNKSENIYYEWTGEFFTKRKDIKSINEDGTYGDPNINLDKNSEIKRLGLRETWDKSKCLYYNDEQGKHYEWTGHEFVERSDISTVLSDSYSVIDADYSIYKNSYIKKLNLKQSDNERFYYSKKDKCYYEWTGETFIKRADIKTISADGTYIIH